MAEFRKEEEYNRGGLIAFVFSMTFVLSFIVYLVLIHPGVISTEKVVDPHAAPAAGGEVKAEFNIDQVKEPWVMNEQVAQYGKKLFEANCTMCHGPEGKGDGAAGKALNPPPRNLVEGKWKMGEGMVNRYKVITSGFPPPSSMAAYGHFKPADRWALVQFIESITQNKSKDSAATVAEFAKTAK